MKHGLKFAAFVLLMAFPCQAQLSYQADAFQGWVGGPTAVHPHKQMATCSQATTTQTCTVQDGTQFAVHEPMMINGTGTAMDWVDVPASAQRGASLVATCAADSNNHCTISTLTLTAPVSQTVGSTPGTIQPARPFIAMAPGGGGYGPKIFTPLGHWIQYNNITVSAITGVGTKYSTNCQAAQAEINFFTSIGFNGIGQSSAADVQSIAGGSCLSSITHLPLYGAHAPTSYSSVNLSAQSTQPTSDLVDMVNVTFWPINSCTSRRLFDYWAPQWGTFLDGSQGINAIALRNDYESPDGYGVTYDDVGNSGPAFAFANMDFHTYTTGKQACSSLFEVLISSPLLTWVLANSGGYGAGIQGPYVYNDPLNYTKTSSTTPPATCAMITPCRFADYLSKLYGGTIASLNTAWGTSAFYTTFLSSAKCVGYGTGVTNALGCSGGIVAAPELFATGNGVLTSFTATVANVPVSKCSVQVILTPSGGSALIVGGSSCANTTGVIGGPNNFQASTAYALNGLITDSNGNIENVTTAGTTAASAPSWPGTCTGSQTTVSNTATFTCIGTGINRVSSTITWATGSMTIVTNNALQNLATLTLSYTQNGWGLGTGILDEDGRNTTWVGTTTACLKAKPSWTATHFYNINDIIQDAASGSWQIVVTAGTSAGSLPTFSSVAGTFLTDSGGVKYQSIGVPVCGTGGDYPAPNMQAQMATDLENWLGQEAYNYYNSISSRYRARWPDMLNFGTNASGTQFSPAPTQVVQAMQAAGVDILRVQLIEDSNFDPLSSAKYSQLTQFWKGSVQDTQFPVSLQTPTSGACLGNLPCFSTRQAMGQWWYTLLNAHLHARSWNGTFQWAGENWEYSLDGTASSSYGVATPTDNPYNGHDDVVAVVSCSAPNAAFNCGGEGSGGNYLGTDEITHAGCGLCITDANSLWLIAPQPPKSKPWIAKTVSEIHEFMAVQ
jgi:hypothetical protein